MTRTPLAVLVVLAALLSAVPVAHAGPVQPRIVGGQDVDVAQAPYVAALVNRPRATASSYLAAQFCGGSLIAPRAVLTAAHCVEDETAGNVAVVVGLTDLEDRGGQLVPVRRIKVHEAWNPETSANDIAVLFLAEDAFAQTVRPAPAGTPNLVGTRIGIFGWGALGPDDDSSPVLQGAVLRVVDTSGCSRDYEDLGLGGIDGRRMLCARGESGFRPDTCPGDSGGPAVAADAGGPLLVGITSFGGPDGCGNPPAAVYTRVSAYAGWIARQLGAAPAPGPAPAPRPPSGKTRLRFSRVECGLTCRVTVRISGGAALSVTRVNLRVIGRDGGFDRTVAARRTGAREWRARITLPFGVVRLVARAFGAGGRTLGNRLTETIEVVEAR